MQESHTFSQASTLSPRVESPRGLSPESPPLSPVYNTTPGEPRPQGRTPHLIHTCNTISRTLPDYPVVLPPRTEKHPLPIRTPGRRGPQCSDSGTDPDTLGHARGRCSLHLVPTDRTNGRSQTLVSVFRVNRAQIAWRGRRRETAKKKKGLFPLSLPFFFSARSARPPSEPPRPAVAARITRDTLLHRGAASFARLCERLARSGVSEKILRASRAYAAVASRDIAATSPNRRFAKLMRGDAAR